MQVNKKLSRLWATKNKNDEWWSSFVTSPLAIAVNYIVIDTKWLTPNRITLFSFLTAILAALFIIIGGTFSFVIAAILIHVSHILDCMDGQMARYRKITSLSGEFFDKLTDQVQVIIWFGSVGYAAYAQSQHALPVFLAFMGVAFYSLRGYIKYVAIYTEISRDNSYLEKISKDASQINKGEVAGLGFGILANLRWFIKEQRKIILFNEGVFIFMLSVALVFDKLMPMLWVFAISQIYYGFARGWQRGCQMDHHRSDPIEK